MWVPYFDTFPQTPLERWFAKAGEPVCCEEPQWESIPDYYGQENPCRYEYYSYPFGIKVCKACEHYGFFTDADLDTEELLYVLPRFSYAPQFKVPRCNHEWKLIPARQLIGGRVVSYACNTFNLPIRLDYVYCEDCTVRAIFVRRHYQSDEWSLDECHGEPLFLVPGTKAARLAY